MSLIQNIESICPYCKKTHTTSIWLSIDVAINPEIKEKLLAGSFYYTRCPNCQQDYEMDYSTVYKDYKNELIIYYIKSADEIEKIYDDIKNVPSGIQKRIVKSKDELKEKILIFDNGFNDKAIELLKHTICQKEERLFLTKKNTGFCFVTADSSKLEEFDFDKYRYSFEEKSIRYYNDEKDEFFIDSIWAKKISERIQKTEENSNIVPSSKSQNISSIDIEPLNNRKDKYGFNSIGKVIVISVISLMVFSVLIAPVLFFVAFHEHEWLDATCTNPKTCSICEETEGNKLNHIWISATCSSPKRCSRCDLTIGEKLSHEWIEATENMPEMCKYCKKMNPMPDPENGKVFICEYDYMPSEITITCPFGESCYIKLKDTNKNDILSFFVKAGTTVTVPAPQGSYYVYFASGSDWYGPEYIFGEDTVYSKDKNLCDFSNYTWSYTLQPTYNGNFTETPIDENEFK